MGTDTALKVGVIGLVAVVAVIGAFAVLGGGSDDPSGNDATDIDEDVQSEEIADHGGHLDITQEGDDVSVAVIDRMTNVESWGAACGSQPETLDKELNDIGAVTDVEDCDADAVVVYGEIDGEAQRIH